MLLLRPRPHLSRGHMCALKSPEAKHDPCLVCLVDIVSHLFNISLVTKKAQLVIPLHAF